MEYTEIEGNLITLAKKGTFDVIAHGCNCFCAMGAGLAPQMAEAFACDHYQMENESWAGYINKLGTIDYGSFYTKEGEPHIAYSVNKTNEILEMKGFKKNIAVNCYSQYGFGRNHKEGSVAPLDYEALTLCLRKINHTFKGQHVGLPQIGCHLAGGDWNVVKEMIQKELKDCQVTVVIFNNK